MPAEETDTGNRDWAEVRSIVTQIVSDIVKEKGSSLVTVLDAKRVSAACHNAVTQEAVDAFVLYEQLVDIACKDALDNLGITP